MSVAHARCPHESVPTILSELIDTAARHGIYIFPRSGFLLGIARHKGFLPQEADHIDADLGVFDSPALRKTKYMTGDHGSVFMFEVLDKWPMFWWLTWLPWRAPYNIPYQVNVRIISQAGHYKTELSFFHHVDKDIVVVPVSNSLGNIVRSLREHKRYAASGSGFRGRWGGYYIQFDADDFSSTIRLPFYSTTISVPKGYRGILKAYYGSEWHDPERRAVFSSMAVAKMDMRALPPCSIRVRSGRSLV